jgi:hypothetical protein
MRVMKATKAMKAIKLNYALRHVMEARVQRRVQRVCKAKDKGDIGREGIKDVVKDTPVPVLGQVHSESMARIDVSLPGDSS